jgi:molybdate transport system ATP-binding protein
MLDVDIRAEAGDFCLNVSFQTHSGEMLALFGPSGAGKSLTLRCLAGLVRPLAGRITLNGRALFDAARGIHAPPRVRRVGYVPQNYALFPHLTVVENIAYGLAGLARGARQERVADMVHLMRLQGLEARRPARLSGGQQQRVALARALLTEPEILLLDEPFAALDGLTRGRLQNELLSLQRRFRLPIVLVTHDLAEAYSLSDRLAVFDAGRVLQVGPKEEVLRQPATHAVARFVGARNIFEGQVVDAGSDSAVVAWEGHLIHTPASGLRAGQWVHFCIRPEEIKVMRANQPLRPILRENLLHGQLARAIDRGAMHTLFFKGTGLYARDYDLEILLPHPSWQRLGLTMGQAMTVTLKKSAIHVLTAE